MNQKKCPKCGEMNPPEAVMCWACYTPLAGAGAGAATAAAPATGGKKAAKPVTNDEEKEKSKITPVQMGVFGVLLVVALGYGAMTLFGGGGDVPTDNAAPGINRLPRDPGPGEGPAPVSPGGGPAAPSGGGGTAPAAAFTMVAAPSPSYTSGTMAILATNPSTNPQQAYVLARSARSLLTAPNKWQPLSIFVFADSPTAQNFKEYQAQRGNQPLTDSDYRALTNVWQNTLACYRVVNGKEQRAIFPKNNPTGWWQQPGS